MEHPRTTSARDHDDRDLIEEAGEEPTFAGSAGGNLQRDVGSRGEMNLADPERRNRPNKQAKIDNDDAERSQRARAPDN